MKVTKALTVTTFGIGAITFIMIFLTKRESIIYDISLALFGSAALGGIMSVVQYHIAKKVALQFFEKKAIECANYIYKIPYFPISDPADIVAGCLSEEWKNDLMKDQEIGEIHEKRNELFKKIKYSGPEIAEKEYKEMWYEMWIEKYKEEIRKCSERYRDFTDKSLVDFRNAYDEIDFIFKWNTRLSTSIKMIHDDIIAENRFVDDHYRMIRDVTNGADTGIAIDEFEKLNKHFFRVVQNKQDGRTCIKVYDFISTKIANQVIEFGNIIRKEKVEKAEEKVVSFLNCEDRMRISE